MHVYSLSLYICIQHIHSHTLSSYDTDISEDNAPTVPGELLDNMFALASAGIQTRVIDFQGDSIRRLFFNVVPSEHVLFVAWALWYTAQNYLYIPTSRQVLVAPFLNFLG